MALDVTPDTPTPQPTRLPRDFAVRLEASLADADRERRRRQWLGRARRALALCLLIGPIVGWRLTMVSPGGAHIVIDALAWTTFLLDVGVHLDTSALGFLGLQWLPTTIGVLLFALLGLTLLGRERR